MVDRYALDLAATMAELHRVVCRGGRVICVVGNSCLRDVFVENDRLVTGTAEWAGFRPIGWHFRELPPVRRYLPPSTRGDSTLTKRMRTESVLTLLRP